MFLPQPQLLIIVLLLLLSVWYDIIECQYSWKGKALKILDKIDIPEINFVYDFKKIDHLDRIIKSKL